MKTKIIILLALLLGTQSCNIDQMLFSGGNKDDKTGNPGDPYYFLITHTVYSQRFEKKSTFYYTGLLQVQVSSRYGEPMIEAKYSITADELNNLKQDLYKLSFKNLNDQYGFDNTEAPFDLPVTMLKYEMGGLCDSTLFYWPKENEMPNELKQLLSTINSLLAEY